MNSFLFAFSALYLLALTKSLPCIGKSCGGLSAFYSEYDDDDGVYYIREGSHNSASSNDDANNDENPEKENNIAFPSVSLFKQQYQQQRPNHQRPSHNYEQRVAPNTPDQGPYQSNQQPSNSMTLFGENQETQFRNPDHSNQGNYNSFNQRGNGGYYQNNDVGFNQRYPGSGHQGGGEGIYQNNGARNNGRYPGRQSTYASDFGNGNYNKNIINIEK